MRDGHPDLEQLPVHDPGRQQTSAPAHEPAVRRGLSPVQRLQRGLGNARLAQLRGALQRQASGEAPAWIKDQLGVTAESENAMAQRDQMMEAADSVQIPTGGSALPPAVQRQAEAHLGTSLDGVSVVSGANSVCDALGATAFAAPQDGGGHTVVLSGGVDLASAEGQHTLMHELSHVAQQRRGESDGLHGLGGDEAQRHHLEQKADHDAARILTG